MEKLREHMKKIMWFIAAIFIGGIFFWYGRVRTITDAVANINNSKIKVGDYHKRVTQQLRRTREESEDELTDEHIMQIRRKILSAMITEEVLYQESKRIGIIVTDEEVVNTIHNLPQFQQDSKFNFNLYAQTLKYSMNSEPDDFELLIRRDISNRKLERLVINSTKVTPAELSLYYSTKYGDMTGFKDKNAEVMNEILQSKRTELYKNWMNTLQQNTKIKVNTELAGLTAKK
ncbi:MAG: SurA N-terminal domain-containing protein [Elusimicrobiota bacterium]